LVPHSYSPSRGSRYVSGPCGCRGCSWSSAVSCCCSGVVAFFSYFIFPFSFFLVIAISLGMLGLALGFVKIGGKDLPGLLSNLFIFLIGPKRYIWEKGSAPIQASPAQYQNPEATVQDPAKREIKLVQKSKIKDLSTRIETNK